MSGNADQIRGLPEHRGDTVTFGQCSGKVALVRYKREWRVCFVETPDLHLTFVGIPYGGTPDHVLQGSGGGRMTCIHNDPKEGSTDESPD